ncbi:hypothetical protein [Thalassoglobus sp.]|uniref:hypothetical protein n=1 Tax=Thalassoglobus sp. TaxID=2795869 RepID=UPI003AA8601E
MSDTQVLMGIVFLGLAGWFVLAAIRPKSAIRLVIEGSTLVDSYGISSRARSQIETFVKQDLDYTGKLRVTGNSDSKGRVHLKFRGRIDSGTQQQIRNFLLTIL